MNLPNDFLSLFVRDTSGQKPTAFMDEHQLNCSSCQVLLQEKLDPDKVDIKKLDATEDKAWVGVK